MSVLYDSSKPTRRWSLLIAVAVLIVIILLACFLFVRVTSGSLEKTSEASIKAAVLDSAIQCYSVEGAYPDNVEYLEDNYGLQINHDDYYVTYDVFASNVPPDVSVIARKGGDS